MPAPAPSNNRPPRPMRYRAAAGGRTLLVRAGTATEALERLEAHGIDADWVEKA